MEKVFKQTNQESTQQYPKKIFANQLITMDDLQQFKEQLFKELENLLKPHASLSKKWLKSNEVKRLLKISAGTLQNLKSSGVLPYTKIGGVHFYDIDDIMKILQSGKINYHH
jgi:hypothetical protein